ncbi:signal peptidase II [Streptomyces montanisoli]|uniref:Lipoprotein signal peptidase n=1 Tax=Streptomyces montanisoli TaxID=2798581 RepID=A0A940MGZ2_9ACTN|nr:signal peptidase II [Streptomyces montanisoli]MBP0459417.1 signal peptidase II [Streptomyces montanisoli]
MVPSRARGRGGTTRASSTLGIAPDPVHKPSAEPAISSQKPPKATAAPTSRRRRVGVLLCVGLFAYLLDLVTKVLVVAHLENRSQVSVIGDWLTFRVIRNAGAAFSTGQAMTAVFTVIAAVVIVVIFRIAHKLYSLPWAIGLGLLLGGACGNLTDRLLRAPGFFRGAVVDFIAVRDFAVFNLADSAICCGGALIVLISFLGTTPDGTTRRDAPEDGAGEADRTGQAKGA